MIDDSFVVDSEAIPHKQRLSYEVLCQHKHPGVCQADIHPAASAFHAALQKLVHSWPVGTLWALRADYFESAEDLGSAAMSDDICWWYRVKAFNTKDGFAMARLKTWGPYDKPFVDWELAEGKAGWTFEMSQKLALEVVPPNGSQSKFLSRCVAFRYATMGDPSTPAEAARCLPIALGIGEHVAVMSQSVLYPLPSVDASKVVEAKDVASRDFNNLVRKGCRDCPMPAFDLDVDPPEENEDDIEVARLEKSMCEHISRQRAGQRKQQLRATHKRMQPKKRGRDGGDARGDFHPDDCCRVHGLVQATEYNGLVGTVIKWADNLGRWVVRIDEAEGGPILKKSRIVNMDKMPGAGGAVAGSGSSSSTGERQLVAPVAGADAGVAGGRGPIDDRVRPGANQIELGGRIFSKLKRGNLCLLCLAVLAQVNIYIYIYIYI